MERIVKIEIKAVTILFIIDIKLKDLKLVTAFIHTYPSLTSLSFHL